LLDAARLWKSGIPVGAIVWDSFEGTGQAHVAVLGVTGLPLHTVPDMRIGESDTEQEEKGVAVARLVSERWDGAENAREGAQF
jgi:hypothetical protein